MYVLQESKVVAGLEQGSQEWLQLRRTSLTSTDIAATLPRVGDTQNAMVNFTVAKNAATTDLSGNIKVGKGKEFEPIILQKFINKQFALGRQLPDFDLNSFVSGQVWVRDIEFVDGQQVNRKNTLLSSHDG
ncbi:MAG: YqaJ viral recombinase family protein, partial [Paraclostridium sp.]